MLKDKKLVALVSLLSITCSSLATATNNSACCSFLKVGVPNLKPCYEFNISSVWLKPGASNLNYVILNRELPAPTPTWREHELQPSFAPGFELGIRYIIPNCLGNDARLNWTHLNSYTSNSTTAPNPNFFLGPDYVIGPGGIPIRNAAGNVRFKYDVVNLDVGQYLDFGCRVGIRFFGGLSNPYLRQEVKTTFSGTRLIAPTGAFSMLQDVNSKFTGLGPRVGLEGTYRADCGIGFIGEAAVAALIGSLDSKTTFVGNAPGVVNNRQFISDKSVYQVIPSLDAKLGVNYQYTYCNMRFIATLGYQAAVYINAISQYLPGSLVNSGIGAQDISLGSIYVSTMNHTLSNYSVQGPFLKFALQI